MAQERESGKAVHLCLDHFGCGVDALGATVVERQREGGVYGGAVELESARVGVQATHTTAGGVGSALGPGRAAFEGTLQFTKERIQGGKPLFEHQAVRSRLFRMFTLLEAARAMARSVFIYTTEKADLGEFASTPHSAATKIFVTEASFEICDIAMQLCGARST